jgi:hypothetical protein
MKYYKPCAPGDNPYIDLRPYRSIVKDSDKNLLLDSDTFRVAVVMLYGILNRCMNAQLLAWCTNTDRKLTATAVRNLKSSGVWIQKGKKQRHDLFTKWANSGKDQGLKQCLSFWLDASVAHGEIVKVKNRYGLREWAKPSYSKTLKNRLKWVENKHRRIDSAP